jgi:uncharacterized protein DUF4926/uncharacterized protein DUF6883
VGFTPDRWRELDEAFRIQHLTQDAEPAGIAGTGQKYTIRAILNGPNGRSAIVVSVWFIPGAWDGPSARDRLSGRQAVSFHPFDVVVLETDQPAHGLKRGDLGAIVDIHSANAIEVEFVTASGRTKALVTLQPNDVREVGDDDLVTVRPAGSPPTGRDA